MQEFIAYAKANPGKLNFGTSGVGSMVHLSAELLMKETGIKMQHLPYKGGSNSMADLLGGTIDAVFVRSPVAVGRAGTKNLKMFGGDQPLSVTGATERAHRRGERCAGRIPRRGLA